MNTTESDQPKARRNNKWDALFESMQGKGEYVLVATEVGPSRTPAGLEIPNPKKDPYSRVVSVGELVPANFVKPGDIVNYHQGFNAMPKNFEDRTSRSYTYVFWKNICGQAPEGADLPHFESL